MIDIKRFNEALERGLEAGYRVKSHAQSDRPSLSSAFGGYLAGNIEEKIREAISTAFEAYFDEMLPGRTRPHRWEAILSPVHRLADHEGEILQCRRCCTIRGEAGSETCPL
jgi:hypothetical protein